MIRPTVEILDARPATQTAAPAVVFRLRIGCHGRVHAMALRVQVHLDARRRRYDEDEQARMYELFGAGTDFMRQLRSVQWSLASLMVAGFEDHVECELLVPCTYDLEVASAKYLNAVRDGDVPLAFLFSGTVFRLVDGAMRIEPVPWDVEVLHRMPTTVWRATMNQFLQGGGWIRLHQATLDRLQQFRGRSAETSWDAAIDRPLESREERPA